MDISKVHPWPLVLPDKQRLQCWSATTHNCRKVFVNGIFICQVYIVLAIKLFIHPKKRENQLWILIWDAFSGKIASTTNTGMLFIFIPQASMAVGNLTCIADIKNWYPTTLISLSKPHQNLKRRKIYWNRNIRNWFFLSWHIIYIYIYIT